MEARRWEDMNRDCLAVIFERVGLKHLMLDVPLVCKSWCKASLIPKCWSTLDFPPVVDAVYIGCITELIKFAVTRSCGSAISIVLPTDCTVDDLHYISDECPSLKILKLPYLEASLKQKQSIPKLIAKFKELEVLRISSGFDLKEIVAEISINCTNFVGLVTSGNLGIEVASTFVTSLTKIKYLVLRGADLPRDSLIHILKGCRDLVLLDVRDCIGFDEDDDEISKLASHIKIFKSEGAMLYSLDDMDCNDYEDFTGNGSD